MPLDFGNISQALRIFAGATAHQSQEHIKPTHQYVALRLVLEGGFFPDEITPHPPVKASRSRNGWILEYAPEQRTDSEQTVFGGMKTKQIDVVVAKNGIGPVVAVSVKGTFRAYRNLVNRMEEAIGDSTNVHVMYPGLVYGFLSLLRANRQSDGYLANDMGVAEDNTISPQIRRYYAALCEMAGRRFIRNDYTRYESVGLVLVENSAEAMGTINPLFPEPDTPLRVEPFFSKLFDIYDLRYPFRAEHLPSVRRAEWLTSSPLFQQVTELHGQSIEEILGYTPRICE
ncbi:hypothetical protein [Desulfomonile tiedjei]|uniref:Uncharacterized protein n=1 Tax=Desulfomonile tiedjei (strain ATCC 49306 / DSM 6799 / DCB-1) TaxID=706587 RepID=I4C198_DESTA|nr:hypothetical protein [Desulfomonile tiedjei]AFM23339.1 hypothetical protein Desti_0611 [Desulfomonile tiedjei DSM 6799]